MNKKTVISGSIWNKVKSVLTKDKIAEAEFRKLKMRIVRMDRGEVYKNLEGSVRKIGISTRISDLSTQDL